MTNNKKVLSWLDEMVKLTGTDRETNLKQMFFALEGHAQTSQQKI